MPQTGKNISTDGFQDYSAHLYLEIIGANGKGLLEMRISGNDYKHLDSVRDVVWEFGSKKMPLDEKGLLDKFMLEYNPEKFK